MQTDRQTDGQRRCVKAPLLANVTAAGQTDRRTDGRTATARRHSRAYA